MRVLAAVLALLAVTACGRDGDKPPPLPPGATPMPDVVGLRLDAAKSDLAAVGLDTSRVEVVGGGTFGVLRNDGWWVCDQDPRAGRAVPSKARVLVDREGQCGRGDKLR